MLRNSPASLKHAVSAAPNAPGGSGKASLCAAEVTICWHDLIAGSMLAAGTEVNGRSVLIATTSQLTAGALLLELDGVAGRVVLYPPDLSLEHLSFVARVAAVDIIVSDREATGIEMPSAEWVAPEWDAAAWQRKKELPSTDSNTETEWVLLTSGTTGRPKLVAHTFASLAQAILQERSSAEGVVWSTFYDIRRYGGLQIFLRAALTGTSLVLSSAKEPTDDFLARAGKLGVTHISGTPSHWRRAAMSSAAALMQPVYVRLSGEIADQAILNHLQALYPKAKVAHAFATTEAGVVFTVNDGRMGFPGSVLETTPEVEMKIDNGALLVRSQRTARSYLGDRFDVAPVLRDADGFVNTGDVLEERQGRYYFAGRGDGVINVGGMKVHPEEVEAVINSHPGVQMSLVRTRKSSIVGSVVVADVVLKSAGQAAASEKGVLHSDILRMCREALDTHKVPASINFVPALPVAETGKLIRRHG